VVVEEACGSEGECRKTIEIRYIEGERVIKINFGFMYRFTNS